MNSNFSLDGKEVLIRIIKYILEGGIVALAAALIPKSKLSLEEVLTIALCAAATFSLLDLFSPSLGAGLRSGASFALGTSLVGGLPVKPL